MTRILDRIFGIEAANSNLGTEIRAGFTTFLAMAYILFVNPQILSQAIPLTGDASVTAQLLTATALSAAVGSLMMGLFAKYPIAVAPGMGLNAYFVYSVVIGHGVSWKVALGTVFVSGVIFLMLSLSGIREAVINGIPLSLKRAMAVGIGFFLAFIGLNASGLVVAKQSTIIGLGTIDSAPVLLTLLGLIVSTVLLVKRVPGALLISMIGVSLIAVVFQMPVFNGKAFPGFPETIVSLPVMPVDLFGEMDLRGAMQIDMLGVVLTFLFVAFFDTAGTLIGLAEKAKLTDVEGRIPRASQVFTTDAVSTCVGAILGTSTTTAYVESAAGIEEGGRTGMVAVVVAGLFLVSLFFSPLASVVPAAATAPTLIILGAMMMESVTKISWADYQDAIPAFLTIILMPLTSSISTGISVGVISFVLIRLLAYKIQEVSPVMYGLALLLAIKMILIGG